MCSLYHSGWIDVTGQVCPCSHFTLAKLAIDSKSPSAAASIRFTLSVKDDFSWTVISNGNIIHPSLLSAMPQSIVSVQDVLTVAGFLNRLVPCCGNNDRKFLPLIESRKGSFLNALGNVLNAYTITMVSVKMTVSCI